MAESISTEQKNETGRPSISDDQYTKWLEDLAPFLKLGDTLWDSIGEAELIKHKTVIYDKYAQKDWFAERVDIYRSYPAKATNHILVRFVFAAEEKQKQGIPVSEDEMKNVRMFAEKARVTQPYFVNRQENADGKTVAEVLHELEESDTKDDVVENIQKENAGKTTTKQVVAANPPIPNQEQAGAVSEIQPQPNATAVS